MQQPMSAPDSISSWSFNNAFVGNVAYVSGSSIPGSTAEMKDARIEKKPVDVVNNIVGKKPEMVLNDLDKQIKIVKRRLRTMQEIGGNTRDEGLALTFLKARLKYKKLEHLFAWQITTQELIEKLCAEYKVMCVDFGGYSRNVPTEGLDQLEKFLSAWAKVCDGKPSIRLIVDVGGKEAKKDPILLAQSPFGAWWYILGAWDKEVEIVDDLVYHGK